MPREVGISGARQKMLREQAGRVQGDAGSRFQDTANDAVGRLCQSRWDRKPRHAMSTARVPLAEDYTSDEA